MLTIGALAELAGTTPRAIRHYHALGVLPEPSRRANGYREYDLRDAVRLVRVRRLVELGLSLPDVATALGTGPDAAGEGPGGAAGGPGSATTGSVGPAEHGLRQVLVELDEDLARQEAALRGRRERLAELLAREVDLTASDRVADLLRDVASAVPGVDAAALARERELLEMVEATSGAEQFAEVAEQYRTALADPDQLARMTGLATRFEALAGADPADPEVESLATELAAVGLGQPEPAERDDGWRPAWEAFLATLPPAQRRCMELGWEVRARCAG